MENVQHVVLQERQLYNTGKVIQSGTINWKPAGDTEFLFSFLHL